MSAALAAFAVITITTAAAPSALTVIAASPSHTLTQNSYSLDHRVRHRANDRLFQDLKFIAKFRLSRYESNPGTNDYG
jgi:hypothetical protein